MMGLLAPGWLALLLLAGPIVFLHRRRARPRPQPVGNLFIWKRILAERPARPHRAVPSLLLLLQLAALLAASLALAQPVLLRPARQGPPIHVVLDGSASMMAATSDGTRFGAALEELAAQSARFPEASYTLVLARGLHPQVLAQDVDRAGLLQAARETRPAYAPVSWEQVGRLLASLPRSPWQLWLVGDGQGDAVGALNAALDGAGVEAPLSFLPVGEPLPNLAVTAFSARPSGTSLDRYALLVEAANASDQSARARLTVTLSALDAGGTGPDRVILEEELEVEARGTHRLQRELALPPEGAWVLEARLDAQDPFPLDDQAWLVVQPPRPTLVYLASVRGDPWLRALRALPEVAVTWRRALPSQPPEGYDLVIYDGLLPGRLPPAASVVVPGPRETGDPSGAGPSQPGLGLPWNLFYGEPVQGRARPSWWHPEDPLFQFVDWSDAELGGLRPIQAQAGMRVLMDSPAGPLMARLEDPPALLLGFDPGQGRLPRLPAFPVWTAQLVRWANPQAWNRVAPGAELGQVLHPPTPGRLVDLAGQDVASGPWLVDRPGVYRFLPEEEASGAGTALWARATAPLPRAETDLTQVAPAVWIEPGEPLAPAAGSAPLELAQVLIVSFALLLLAELLLWLREEGWSFAASAAGLRFPWPALTARVLALALAAASAAGLSRPVPSDLNELWVLLDRSDSIDTTLQEASWRWVSTLQAQADGRRLGVLLFGAQPAVEQTPAEPARLPPSPRAVVSTQETDLEAALRLAASRLEPPARLVLASDGHATRGDVWRVVEPLRQRDIPVDVLPLSLELPSEVAIEQVRVRPQVDPGAPYRVRVALQSGQEMPARLVLRAGGATVAEQAVTVPAGSSVYDLSARAPDRRTVLPLEVTVEAPQDPRPENNRAEAALQVGAPPRIAVVHGGSSAVAPLLEAQGLETARLSPAELPADPAFWEHLGALVLENVPAAQLTAEQRRAVTRLVRDLGGGLLVVGGPQGYRSGGYQETELAELLPVSLALPLDLLVPRVALVLLIDRSGSMGEHQGQRTKLDLAKQASLNLLENLASSDALGILAFDTQATWVVPLGPVGSGAGVLERLAQLKPSGGTHLGPALDQAITGLQPVPAVVKHLLILTDGKSTPGPFLERARAAREAGMTLSTVAIGRNADRTLLEELAREGGGRHYYTDDVERLPEIFLREIRAITAPQVLAGPHEVQVQEREPFLGPDPLTFEPLERLNAASAREGATLHLATEGGRPVLASWSYGLGRVAAFLSHPAPGWAGEWGRLPALWAQIARWLLPPPSGLLASSHLEIASGAGTLTVDLLDLAGGYVNFAPLEGSVQLPDGSTRPLSLDQVAPGRYQATFPAVQPGAYLATLWRTDLGEAIPVVTASSWVAAAPELALHPRPDPGLYELARATGGRVLSLEDGWEQVWEPAPGDQAREPLQGPLALSGLALFLGDLALRLRGRRRWRGV